MTKELREAKKLHSEAKELLKQAVEILRQAIEMKPAVITITTTPVPALPYQPYVGPFPVHPTWGENVPNRTFITCGQANSVKTTGIYNNN